MTVDAVFTGLAVADFPAARLFYEQLFGRAPDMLPTDGEAAWQVCGPAWVYVVEDAERAGRGLLTILVDDLDAQVAALAERGVTAGPVQRTPGVVARTRVTDPEGNAITFGQPLSR
ncbi:MAG: VOC family protein [Actinomycetota bacterium]|nr:VOC family protein [Actinomycetota bacterium]